MSVPKKRRTSSSVGRRRSHHALTTATPSLCPKCGRAVVAHRACEFCGTYKGRVVIDVQKKLDKKEQKRREREEEQRREEEEAKKAEAEAPKE